MHDKMKTYLTAFAPLHSAVVSQRQVAVNDDDGPSPDDVATRARPLQRRPDPPGAFAAITAITKLTGPFGQCC